MNRHALTSISAEQFVFSQCPSNTATIERWIFLDRSVVLRRCFLQVSHDLHSKIIKPIDIERKWYILQRTEHIYNVSFLNDPPPPPIP